VYSLHDLFVFDRHQGVERQQLVSRENHLKADSSRTHAIRYCFLLCWCFGDEDG